ncbi:MAG: hypothetical protein HP495_02875 [Nitrospira sp.]|nr:hypothetical protein [Nitrospira sp.]
MGPFGQRFCYMKQWASPVLVLVLTTSLFFLGVDARAQSSSEHHPASIATGTLHNLQNEPDEGKWEGSTEGIAYSEFNHRFVLDIDKFEFLLPNFGGRIQRENWVRSAQVEHYRKYKQWLGEGEPPHESLDLPTRNAEPQPESVQDEEKLGEMRVETQTEKMVVQHGNMPVDTLNEPAGDLDSVGTGEPLDEGQVAGESPDDLKQIRGVGPALERFLHKRGVFWFSQVATWSSADIDKFEFLLPNFGGRIQRENWVGSAKVEYYKKYKQWLGDGEPPTTTPEMH